MGIGLERNEKVNMISLSGKDYNLYCNGDGDYRRKKFYFLTTDNSVRSPLAISGESLIKHKKELSNSSSIINS
ncbi:MAG: hypothetical protein MJ252_21960, partial [archaeon]|nr:hypothetical protein [archaeon]